MSQRRVLFTGSRRWEDRAKVMAIMATLPIDAVVIVGECRGLDEMVIEEAEKRGLQIQLYVADWTAHGRAAGPKRNQRMIDEGKPTEAHAFPLDDSRGTWDCVRRCQKAGVPIRFHEEGEL